MKPELIPLFLEQLKSNKASFVKGNRFTNAHVITRMPKIRLLEIYL